MAYPLEKNAAVFDAFTRFFEKTLLEGSVQPLEETFYFSCMTHAEDPSKRYVAYVVDDLGGPRIYIRQMLEGFVGGVDELPLVHSFQLSRRFPLNIFPDSVDIFEDKYVLYRYDQETEGEIRSIKVEKKIYQRLRELFEEPLWIENKPEV